MVPNISGINSYRDLKATLRAVDISVPPLSEDREKKQKEANVLCSLIATLGRANLLKYPLSLDLARERPDSLLLQAGTAIGIEVSVVTSPEIMWYLQRNSADEKTKADELIEVNRFRLRKQNPSTKRKRYLSSLPTDRLVNPPRYGDQPEQRQQWAGVFSEAIGAKVETFRKTGFQKFDQNWLALRDDAPIINQRDKAIAWLHLKLLPLWQETDAMFDAIFIERGATIIRLTEFDSIQLEVDDLWTAKLPQKP